MATIGVFNANDDVIDLLTVLLRQHGHRVVGVHITDAKRGRVDLAALAQREGLDAAIFDITFPYRENWEFFETVTREEGLSGLPYVVTTTNRVALERETGAHPGVFEIVQKPYDLEQIVAAVERALRRSP